MYRDHFTICNQLSELAQIRSRLAVFLHKHTNCHGHGDNIAEEMLLVAEELIVNTITHGYPDQQQQHLIDIKFEIDTQNNFAMVFCDDALPFNPLTAEEPILGLSSEEVAIGGLGIPLVKALSDQQYYQHHQGKNILRILKSLATN